MVAKGVKKLDWDCEALNRIEAFWVGSPMYEAVMEAAERG